MDTRTQTLLPGDVVTYREIGKEPEEVTVTRKTLKMVYLSNGARIWRKTGETYGEGKGWIE